MTHTVQACFEDTSLVGQTVTVQGWVRSRRDSKAGISFLAVHDGSTFDPIQAVIPADLANYHEEILKLTKDCSVVVTGELAPSQGKGQSVEIQASEVEVVGWVDDPETYPVSPKRHTMEHLREYAHLRPRTNIIGAVTRVRHTLMQAIHHFFDERGFLWISTPTITSSDCEGAGEMFTLTDKEFFGQEASLTVSGQLTLEPYAMSMSKVYSFGPAFRAENSNTKRHLAEFWMCEPEVAFADLPVIIELAHECLTTLVKTVLECCERDMAFFNQWVDKTCLDRLNAILNSTLVKVSYTEAIDILEKADVSFEFPVKWGADLQSEHERYLCEQWANGPVVVYDYPKDIKAFYMRMNDDGNTVAAMDFLVPGVGELMGGSQREERLDRLDMRMQEMEIDMEEMNWYRDLRRFGTAPHSGFGMGFERLLSYVTGVANIRDVIPYPRVPGSLRY